MTAPPGSGRNHLQLQWFNYCEPGAAAGRTALAEAPGPRRANIPSITGVVAARTAGRHQHEGNTRAMKFPRLTAIALAAACAAAPALAANDTPTANASGTATVTTDQGKSATATTPTVTETTPTTTVTTTTNAGSPATATTGGMAPIGTAMVNTGKSTTTVTDNANNNALPHQRNPVLADNNMPRAGKVIGSDVYNMQDKKVGSVDDILMGANGQPDQAVLSVKNKLVLVPFDRLVFGNAQANGDNRVILPDETRDALSAMPEFHYNGQNKG